MHNEFGEYPAGFAETGAGICVVAVLSNQGCDARASLSWMHKLLEREEMTKKKARDAAGAEDEEHELAGGVEVERSERRQVLRENKKVMAALRKREIQIELAAAGTDTINESKRGLEEVPHEIFRGPGSVERLGLAQIVDFSENELEYLPDQIVEDKQALIVSLSCPCCAIAAKRRC